VDFGTVAPGQTADRSFTVRNNSTNAASLSASVPSPFAVINGPLGSLAPGAEQTVTVRYSPAAVASDVGSVVFQLGSQNIRRGVSGRCGAAVVNTGAITGVIQGENGSGGFVPLRNAQVELGRIPAQIGAMVPVGDKAETDAEGRYWLRNVPPKSYILTVTPSGKDLSRYYSKSAQVQSVAGATSTNNFQIGLKPTDPENYRNIPVVLVLGIGPVGAAFFLWDHGMKRGDPRLLGTLAYATPVASTLLLALGGFAELTPVVLAAAALVALGGLLAARA
jgi:hypothetical protein